MVFITEIEAVHAALVASAEENEADGRPTAVGFLMALESSGYSVVSTDNVEWLLHRTPQIQTMGQERKASDPGMVWVRISEEDGEKLRRARDLAESIKSRPLGGIEQYQDEDR